MVPETNPVILLVNVVNPAPLLVLVVKSTVGLEEVDQTTPLAVTASTKVELIVAPLDAVVAVIELTAVVVIGSTGSTFKVSLANNSKLAACVEVK